MNVKLLRIITGEEVLAEVLSEDASSVTVQNGLVVLPNANGVGFAPWATVISKENKEITLSREHLVYVVDCDDSVQDKYESIFGTIVKPETKKTDSMKSLKTPLRYPGGKSRACTKMDQYFPDLRNYKQFREPFLGGGSVAIHITKKYPTLDIWVNDLYEPLYNFWCVLRDDHKICVKL